MNGYSCVQRKEKENNNNIFGPYVLMPNQPRLKPIVQEFWQKEVRYGDASRKAHSQDCLSSPSAALADLGNEFLPQQRKVEWMRDIGV
ncbi:unnamed protein product [Citrullus colocynthis]|uniref:Uncharacterized protein n=1 Tax=Citrullus colocynthis TaxID=252529 RepID=A0ABP0YV79_9ROSI